MSETQSEKIIIARAAESTHWYDHEGNPQYTRRKKNGTGDRATTLADARRENLVPSVTSILQVAARPGLQKWIETQLVLSALTLPKLEGETLESYAERVIADSREQGKKAMELGTNIHAACERYYETGEVEVEYAKHVEAALNAVYDKYGSQVWIAEKSFAHPLGYGGKTDLHSKGANVLIDFKTKSFNSEQAKKGLAYDEMVMQMAAYRVGLGMQGATCALVFISTLEPGLVVIEEFSEEEVKRGWDMFQHLLSYWKIKNNFEGQRGRL